MTVAELPRVPWRVPSWHEEGSACRLFPDLDWIEARKGSPQELAAKIVCSVCPVRKECATGALERGEPFGIWGGLDRKDRKALALEYGYPAPSVLPEHGTNARRVKHGCDCRPCKSAHALYESERRWRARRKAGADVWLSPLLILTAPVRIGRRVLGRGQYLLPLDLPKPRQAQPEPSALALAA